jgi:hypothetical protein
MWATRNRVHMLSPLMLLPLYYDIPVSAKRLQRARTEKAISSLVVPAKERHPRILLSGTGTHASWQDWIPACAESTPQKRPSY